MRGANTNAPVRAIRVKATTHDKTKKQYSDETKKLDITRTEFYEHQKYIGKIESEQEQKQNKLSKFKTEKDDLNKKEVKFQAEYAACPKITGGMILKDEIVATATRVTELNEKAEQSDDEIHQERNHLTKKEGKYERIGSEIKHIREKLELAENSLFTFESQKNAVLKILTVRGFESLESCLEQIENERTETNRTVLNLKQDIERLELEITTIEEHGSPLSKDMKNALKWFRSEFSFAKTGSEYLKDLAEDKQKEILNNAPWLTKSIILTQQDFNRIVNSPTSILTVSIMDSSVILTNQSSLQEQKKLSLGDIFVPSRDAEHYIKILDPETTIKRIERDIGKIARDIDKYNDILEMANDDRDAIRLFHDKYPVEFEAKVQQEISDYRESIEKYDTELSVIVKSIVDIKATLKQTSSEKEKIQDELTSLYENTVTHKKLDEVIDTLTKLELSLKECESDIKELDGKYRQANDQKFRLESELKGKESMVTSFRDRVNEIERELKPLECFATVGIDDLQEEEIKKLRVPPYFIATIKDKLKTAGSFREAEQIEMNLDEYSMIIETKTQVQRQQVESLKDVEEKVISQALGIIKIYRDYLKRFPSLSRIILDGRSTEMIRINFNECEYNDDMAISEMRHYIQQLIEDIEAQKISQKELIEYLTLGHLINKVLDMKKISLSIRKIDTNDTRFQIWEKIQASDGQENAMFIIFMVVLMSYIRDIVVDRKDKNTSKVLISTTRSV